MSEIIIAYGTLSEPKLASVRRAIHRIELPIVLIGANTKTGELEQPMGRFGDPAPLSEGMAGARTRATESLVAVPSATYGLGTESQLFEIERGEDLDLAVFYLLKRGETRGIWTTSTGIGCPSEFVAKSLGVGRRVTAGRFYANARPGVAHDNWHLHVTHGRLSRDDLLEQAAYACLSMAFP